MVEASPDIKEYFSVITAKVQKGYETAKSARELGLDPEQEAPIPLANNMAERVVGLISVIFPKIVNTTITKRIPELEKEYGLLDWRVGFKIAEEVAKEKFCSFSSKEEAMEIGIRVGFAYLTLGIVSAPLEGFIGLKIKKRRDGKEYFALQYAGPIRGAGGTAASTSVVLADYVRVKMGYFTYDPDEQEINRYAAEVHDYHDRVTNLQYHPSDEELKFMVSHLPVEIDGDPTEKFEVSNYKDLPRISTNLIRGGMALVLAEGLSQKAPKVWKRLAKWGKDFDLEWGWLAEFLAIKEKIHAAQTISKKEGSSEEEKKVKPNNTFIMDLVAGRPIITYPLGVGGLRLRYGRSRMTGFSATGMNPATLIILNKFIAIGTQLKIERPGKATTVTICEVLEGPIVRLHDGSVRKLSTEEEAKTYTSQVAEVIFLGDILINYGDFSENGQSLVPAGYCPEWWSLEVEKSYQRLVASGHSEKILPALDCAEKRLSQFISDPFHFIPSWEEALRISQFLEVPLHPEYTFYFKLVSAEDLKSLFQWFQEGKIKQDEHGVLKLILPYFISNNLHLKSKRVLEELGVSHLVVNKENILLEKKEAQLVAFYFGFTESQSLSEKTPLFSNQELVGDALTFLSSIHTITIRDKAGTFIGARMGRPEKAKMRALTGSPQVLFPVGEEGGRLRSFQAALEKGKVQSVFPFFYCQSCCKENVYSECVICQKKCIKLYSCRFCGDTEKETCRHGRTFPYKTYTINIDAYLRQALKQVNEALLPDLIKGIRGTSNKFHIVEHLAKGLLRAKYNLYVNKDGTTRYDCTELPITHFKPKEIKTCISKLKELGYTADIHNRELTSEDQLLELKPQDVILPGFDSLDESAPKVLKRVADYVDALLSSFYKLKPFYNLHKEEDLIGHLVIGLAPHISAGLIGRIIGFSETQGLLTHPMYHAGMRRDCDGDEACVMLLMDALLNFSRQYLPERRGAKTMDAPLVLTSLLNPTEVDDQVHGLDVVWRYPLEFYEASLQMKKPWEVVSSNGKKMVEQLSDRLGTPLQYEGFGFTHPVDNFNKGVCCSAYKLLPSMEEKLIGQMDIAQKVRAVNMDDVAKLVIQKHFLRDIKGNLRKFSSQQFRCVKCNTKYRRPPLSGKCHECNSRLQFTITEGSVVKYLGPSLMLAEKYNFSPYLKQILDILKTDVDSIFGKSKDKQVGLGSFMG